MITAGDDLRAGADHGCEGLIKNGQIKVMQAISAGLETCGMIACEGLGNLHLVLGHNINCEEAAGFDRVCGRAAVIGAE